MTATMDWAQDEMIADALKIHEAEHCGATPCSTAVKLAAQLGQGGIVKHGHELATPSFGRGNGHGRGHQAPSGASPKQINLIKRLAAERDYLSLGDTQRKLVQDVCEGTVISKRSASDLISALMVTVPADSRSLRPEFLAKVEQPLASPKQVDFIKRLLAERGADAEKLVTVDLAEMTKAQASALIDALFKIHPQAKSELEAGIYRVDDTWFKVQRAVHGSGFMYAKQLVVDGPGEGHFEVARGAIRNIRPEHKVSLEEARQFGQLYGICCQCSATLTDETSIEAGIGPVCARKFS